MLDVTAVGSNLTLEQQEATLSDLGFFLDEFGSTRAVRVKLHEQQRDIERLGSQVQRLVNGRGVEEYENGSNDEEIAVGGNSNAPNDVDEIMADVDFFLRVYGSTGAVRNELYAQRQKLTNLQSTVLYLQMQQGAKVNNTEAEDSYETKPGDFGENGVDKVESTSAATLVQKVAEHEQQNGGDETSKCPPGTTLRRRASHITCKVLRCMKWVMRDGDRDEFCVRHRVAFATQNDHPNTSIQHEKTTETKEDEDEKAGADSQEIQRKKLHVVPIAPQNEDKDLHVDADCRNLQISANGDVGVSGLIAAYYKQLKNALTVDSQPSAVSDDSVSRELTQSQLKPTENSSKATKQTENADDSKTAVPTAAREASSPRRNSRMCRHPGCTKNSQAHGLCWNHGGYYMCKVEGCTLRAISRKLCRNHGGGTRCRFSDCDKMVSSHGKGYCYRHAREQGIEVSHAGKTSKRYRPRERKIQQEDTKDFGRTSSNDTCRPHHVTCKAFRCMKWVTQDGEYCSTHRTTYGPKNDNSRTTTSDLATSFIHPEHNSKSTEANIVELITSKGSDNNCSSCKVPGCGRLGKLTGAQKGYCFKHHGTT